MINLIINNKSRKHKSIYSISPTLFHTQVMPILNGEKIISNQNNKIIVQSYKFEDGRYYRKKIIKFKNRYEMKWNYQNLKKISLTESNSDILKQLSFAKVQMRQPKDEIQVVVPSIHSICCSRRLKELAIKFSKMNEQTLKDYCFDLIQKLINDGYRPFIPTLDNILLTESSIFLNRISIVGLSLLQFKQAISKADFSQICPFLSSIIFDGKNLEIDYVIFKQRAVLLFALTFLFSKCMMFVLSKQIGQIVALQEANKYVKMQKQRITKFLQGNKAMKVIEKFESLTKIRLGALIKRILIDEQEISWPQFINLFRVHRLPQIQMKLQKIQKDLHTLAQYHWQRYSEYTKKQYNKLKYVSIQVEQTFNQKDVDFFLMRLTKIPLYLLMKEYSFVNILDKSDRFDKISHQLWINFINIIPLGKISSVYQLSQKDHFVMMQQEDSRKQGAVFQLKAKLHNTQQYLDCLFDNKVCVNFKFIMALANKKLTNVIYDSSKKIFIQHEQLKILNKIHDALR